MHIFTLLLIFLFLRVSEVEASRITPCNCYRSDLFFEINNSYYDYLKFLHRKHLLILPPNIAPDEVKFYEQVNLLSQKIDDYPLFFSEFHKNLLIQDRIVDVLSDFWINWYHTIYRKDEKELLNAIIREKRLREESHEAFNTYQNELTRQFHLLFQKCIEKHGNWRGYYENGLVELLEGHYEEAAEFLRISLEKAKESNQTSMFNSDSYQNLGLACIEGMMYEDAVYYLSHAIEKDPNNKEIYLQRAVAYFETGRFDPALNDYLNSEKLIKSRNELSVSEEFRDALLKSLARGVSDAAFDFFPSLLYSTYGLSEALWIFTQYPVEKTGEFVNACYEIALCAVDFFKEIDWEKVEGCIDEVKHLCEKYSQLSESEKGELIGYSIGKYGVDILASGATIKGVQAFNKLKNANRLCNFDTIISSEVNKGALAKKAAQYSIEREKFFKTVKVHWDRQNKHMPGAHNFEAGKGIITVEKSTLERLLAEHAGKGQSVREILPGVPGYVERVDFGEVIGDFALKLENGNINFIPTTKGTIRYAKDGMHVVPSNPNAVIK